MKTLSIISLFIFLFSGSACSQAKDGAPAKIEKVTQTQVTKPSFLVYYFHGDVRCSSCKKIEKYTEEAVRENFQKEIESGQITFQTVNVDEKPNKHFIKDYQLYSKAVVLVDNQEGKSGHWKNLDKIWTLLSKKDAFQNYITEEVETFIKGE